jgi:hypothetical protein
VLALLLSLFFQQPASDTPRFGGTFIGAIVAQDGIVLGSDSRSTFIDKDNHPIGYVDGMQKIYVGSSTGMAVSGLTSVEGELFSTFVDRNQFLLQRTPEEVLFGFSAWLPFNNAVGVMLLSGGFSNGKPIICSRSVVQPQTCRDSGSITNKPSPILQTWVSALHAAPKAADAAAVLQKAIQESAASDATVGGPISIVQIRMGQPALWLENAPAPSRWKTICDLVHDHRAGKVRILPTSSPAELDHFVVSVCP